MSQLNLFQIATMGLGPGRSVLSDITFGFFGTKIVIDVDEEVRLRGRGGLIGESQLVKSLYIVTFTIYYKDSIYKKRYTMPFILTDITIRTFNKIKKFISEVKSWFIKPNSVKQEVRFKITKKG